MTKKVALLVGVGNYGAGLKPLQCPANGVQELEAVLTKSEIGGFDHVIPLIDPDVGTMRSQLGEVFASLKKSDLILFYFTGHGIKDMSGDFYLTTTQTQLFENQRLNPGTAIEADFIKRVIRNCYAQRKVVILDCCFGAAFADGFSTMDDGGMDIEAQLGGEGWAVLTAANSRNYALEQEGEPLSVYTRYLVEGLKTGAAAAAGKDQISVGHLHDYVRAKVKIAAPTMEPTIFNAQQGYEILIAKAIVGDPELKYRQELQKKIRQGVIRPAARAYLKQRHLRLGIVPERAKELEEEVLKPYREKQKHLETYTETLEAELEYEFPLSEEAIQDLKDLQRILSLRDEDVKITLSNALSLKRKEQNNPGHGNKSNEFTKPVSTIAFSSKYMEAEKAYMQNNYEKAATAINQLAQEYPTDPNVLLLRGHIYCYGLQQYKIACEQYKAVLQLTSDPEFTDYANSGLTYANQFEDLSGKSTDKPLTEIEISLESEKGIDYGHLEELLEQQQWKEADQETAKVMLQAAGRTKEGWLDAESIEQFPCADLRTIDQLWGKYSKGHFGFSVQKEIWLEVGGKVDYETEKKLGDRVGWRVKGQWISYDNVTFSTSAQEGHLPWGVGVGIESFVWVELLFGVSLLASRLVDCSR
ncbi:caspase, EACC1-associated type [Sphaerothrix gracilis]|uniref:caspase, EACC1-associated type n=1 Tax=Sphaerothrix gracilis TaxID=3151835 RepID=UPI0031FDB456